MRKVLFFFAVSALSAAAGEFLPLQTGNEWVYREAKTGQTITVRVGTPIMTDDKVYYTLMGYGTQRLFVRNDDTGKVLVYNEETSKEQTLIDFVPLDRAWWDAPYRICEQGGQSQSKRVDYEGPAGPLHQVLEIKYRAYGCADAGTEQELFTENIGMVRRVESSIAGPRTYDLVSARVGKASIKADQSGRFTVTVSEVPGQQEVEIQLELNNSTSGETRLQFYSAQQYDAEIRDSSNHLVWRWSDDQQFAQSLSERVVSGRWVITLRAPRPTVSWPQNGKFFVNGWLPTVGGNQFAASTPFQLSTKAE